MKLYATTTSERASKGQGGNKEINIVLQADAKKRKTVARLLFAPNQHVKDAYFINVYTDRGMTAFEFNLNVGALSTQIKETKGEKKKDDRWNCTHNPKCNPTDETFCIDNIPL